MQAYSAPSRTTASNGTAPADRLRRMVLALTRLFNELDRQESECCGVTVAQCLALTTLLKLEAATVQGLGDALGLAPSTVTRNVAPLCERGWIARERDARDRRQVWLSLSDMGRAKALELEARSQQMALGVLNRLPADRRHDVLASLETLMAACQETQAECCPPANPQNARRCATENASHE